MYVIIDLNGGYSPPLPGQGEETLPRVSQAQLLPFLVMALFQQQEPPLVIRRT